MRDLNRREFLGRIGGLAAWTAGAQVMSSAAVGETDSSRTPNVPADRKQIRLHQDAFLSHLPSDFRAIAPGGSEVSIRLIEVENRSHGSNLVCFRLLFRGPQEQALPQNTYTLRHSKMGELRVFLVPVSRNTTGHQLYEAVFTRFQR